MEEVSEVRADFVLFEKVGNDELCAPALPIYTNRKRDPVPALALDVEKSPINAVPNTPGHGYAL